jgi:tetratricopeptide (TPR) repeat protein
MGARIRSRPLAASPQRCLGVQHALAAALVFGVVLAACAPRTATPDPALATLLAELRRAEDPIAAEAAEAEISAYWAKSNSATVEVLMERAASAEAAGDRGLARAFLVQAAELAPDFAEPWRRRAALDYNRQDYANAIRAIEETLKREPQHFAAFADLGVIYEEMGQEAAALAAYRAALAIHPFLPVARQGEQRLNARLTGAEA